MEGKKSKQRREHEHTAGVVAEKGVRSEVGTTVESESKGSKNRKRSKEVEGDGGNDQDIVPFEKKDRSHRYKELERDGRDGSRTKDQVVPPGKVNTFDLESTRIQNKRGKKSRREREHGYAHTRDLEVETGREQVVPHESHLEGSEIRKKKRERSRKEGEVEVPRSNDALDVDGINVQSVFGHGVHDLEVDSLPVKTKKVKKSRRNRETEFVGHGNQSRSDGDGVSCQAVIQDGVKKKKRKEGLVDRDMEVEEFRNNVSTYGNGKTDQEVDENNQFVLESSSVRKKERKKSRRDKETQHKDHLFTGEVDINRVLNQVVSRIGVVESLEGSFPVKQLKKTVRFQEPEIHWREEDKDEEHQDEEDVGSEVCKLEDKDKSSGVCNEEDSPPKYLTDRRSWEEDLYRTDLKYGYFTKEEDEKLRTAVYDFIKERNWQIDEGVDMLLHCSAQPETRCAWFEIGKCLPYRSMKLINSRAQRLLSPLKRGKWSKEDLTKLNEQFALHGHNWKAIEKVMGRPAQLCKDRWRLVRYQRMAKKTRFCGEEFDQLCMYVRWNMKMKENIVRRQKRPNPMIRDDINWEVIGAKMRRRPAECAVIWYSKLASSLISDGRWANGDDRRFLRSLMESGASSEEAVDWDVLLDNRDGLTCQWRWYQMTRLLSDLRAPFEDKLEQLCKRYAPDLIGIEEDFSLI